MAICLQSVKHLESETKVVMGERRIRRYVSVTTRFDEDGVIHPLSIQWYNGITYPIDEILLRQRRSARKAGGDGMCYKIRIGKNVTYLYHEHPKWFVEEMVPSQDNLETC